jgi:hypothetical protein
VGTDTITEAQDLISRGDLSPADLYRRLRKLERQTRGPDRACWPMLWEGAFIATGGDARPRGPVDRLLTRIARKFR